MGKKILLSIFGGIAVCGLILALVGVAMGGRPGSITLQGSQFVYRTNAGTYPLGNAPSWARRWGGSDTKHSTAAADAPIAASSPNSGHSAGQEGSYADAPFGPGELQRLDIRVEAGYVKVQTGDSFGLSVDGPMEYTSTFRDGKWEIVSDYHGSLSIRWDEGWGRNRFWHNGRDMTTTFTLTVPASFGNLHLNLEAGEATVSDLTLSTVECKTEAGRLFIRNVNADKSAFKVSAGSIEVSGFSGRVCELDCEAGSIEFSGSVSSKLDAECEVGSISVTMPRPSDYGYRAEVNMGTITIDGHSHTGLDQESTGGNQNATPYFDLDCELGAINVNFT